jgi:ribosome-associated protein
MDIRKLQRAIVDGLEDVKAQHIEVFNTEHLSAMFERVIIASGTSNRQTKALAASVRNSVKGRGMQVMATEGEDNGEWIVVDCGAAVAHIMQPSIREYYHLEEIWGGKPVRLAKSSAAKGLVKASEPEPEAAQKVRAQKRPAARKDTAQRSATPKAASPQARTKTTANPRAVAEPTSTSRTAAFTRAAKKATAPRAGRVTQGAAGRETQAAASKTIVVKPAGKPPARAGAKTGTTGGARSGAKAAAKPTAKRAAKSADSRAAAPRAAPRKAPAKKAPARKAPAHS